MPVGHVCQHMGPHGRRRCRRLGGHGVRDGWRSSGRSQRRFVAVDCENGAGLGQLLGRWRNGLADGTTGQHAGCDGWRASLKARRRGAHPGGQLCKLRLAAGGCVAEHGIELVQGRTLSLDGRLLCAHVGHRRWRRCHAGNAGQNGSRGHGVVHCSGKEVSEQPRAVDGLGLVRERSRRGRAAPMQACGAAFGTHLVAAVPEAGLRSSGSGRPACRHQCC